MKPTSLRSLGELVGTLGVLTGLFFVGLELRGNTAVARAETRREVAAQNIDMSMRIAEDDNLTYLWSEPWTLEFVDGLSAMEQARLTNTAIAFILRLESTYLQVGQGLLEEADLGGYGFTMPRMGDPWLREFWAGYSRGLDPEFVEYFESLNGY